MAWYSVKGLDRLDIDISVVAAKEALQSGGFTVNDFRLQGQVHLQGGLKVEVRGGIEGYHGKVFVIAEQDDGYHVVTESDRQVSNHRVVASMREAVQCVLETNRPV